MTILLLMAGLWMATDPAWTLRRLQKLALEMQRFSEALGFPAGRRTALVPPSRGERVAMRCFGIAIAVLAFAGLAGFPR